MHARLNVDLVGPPGSRGNIGDEVRGFGSDPTPIFQLRVEYGTKEAFVVIGPVARRGLEGTFRFGWDEGICVDLAMRMMKRHANIGSSVLEDQDVLDPGQS